MEQTFNINKIGDNLTAKPFLKWVGGKRRLMASLVENLPEKFNDYYEPFLGGGSVLFELINKEKLKNNIYVGDIQPELLGCYQILSNPEKFKELLNELSNEKSNERYTRTKEAFTLLKKEYNELKINPENNKIKLTALFLYLNKTGFNGMYRENKKGEYNIPFGRYPENSPIWNIPNLKETSNILSNKNITWKTGDYSNLLKTAKKGDFIYLDPPYHKTFTGYTKVPFGEPEQIQLKNLILELHHRGCYIMTSNSNTEFINNLYNEDFFTKIILNINRTNGGSKSTGKKEKEILIKNY
jgi:DNA adenine methylase